LLFYLRIRIDRFVRRLAQFLSLPRAVPLLGLAVVTACSSPRDKPEDAVNDFLRAVHKHDCKKVFWYFSTASQNKVREESAKAINDYPSYADQLTPEKFYCSSMFANRFLTYNLGSATLQQIEGNNAVVGVTYTEGTHELIPGFFPTKFVKKPSTIQVIRENGRWKIDLVTPSPAEKEIIEARERAKAKELEMMAKVQHQQEERLREIIRAKCSTFRLRARWTFQSHPQAGIIQDETAKFGAELLGVHIIDLPEGKALQFQADKEAVRLSEDLLNNQACGMIMFWFRRDDAERLNRVLLKVWPGVLSETGIEISGDGQIHYRVQRATVQSDERLEPQKFYRLAFAWGENGLRIYIDGKLNAKSDEPAQITARSKLTELGRDPNNPEKTGSRMTIRDLRIYEGFADEETIARLFAEQ
jgi:Concanavalin A-like lectin/glucanases superfamily